MPGRSKYPANKIKKYRQALQITPTQLTQVLQVTKVTLWRWETGKSMPIWNNLQRLALVLHTTPAQLIPSLANGQSNKQQQEVASEGV